MKEQKAKLLHSFAAGLLLLLCTLSFEIGWGQITTEGKMTVSGIIMDDNRQPLPGVTISDLKSSAMVIADEAGRYSITIAMGDTLLFSHVGYELQKIKPPVNEKLDVVMIGLQGTINEIVVVGYGKQKRVTMTGSVATITTKDLLQSPVSNLTNALAGRLPGLITTQRSGEPGVDASALYIRGLATLGNARPIVVVDGVERSMDYIDPNDIESFSILKDAASTAVFGMRGANGVVMVTTKRGKRSAPQMSFRTSYGKQQPTKTPTFLGSYDYARLKNEALMNDGSQPAFTDEQLEAYKNGTGYNTDYYKFLIKPSQVGNANLNISGGNNIARYFLSAGLNIQEGNYKHTKENDQGYNSNNVMKRFNLRANVDVDVTQNLLVSLNLAGIQTNRSDPNTSASTIMNIMNRMPPIYPIYNPDSSLFGNGTYTSNLLGEVSRRGYRIYLNNTIQGTLAATHKLDFITKNLSVKFSYSYDNTATPSVTYGRGYAVFYPVYRDDGDIDRYAQVGSDSRIDPNGSYGGGNLERITFTEGALNWFRQYGKHNITAMGNWNRRLRRVGSQIPYAFETYLFRAQYNYDSKYMLELNGSYMGSENFPPENRYGLFPSVSAGWVISQEKFINDNSSLNFINLLKFRASYGEVGNDQVGSERFLWFTSWANAGDDGRYWFGTGNNPSAAAGWSQGAIGNPGVTWERGRKLNLALEGSLWKDALSFTVEVFKERRSNILISRGTLTDVFGQNIKPQNLGIVDNKGIDIDLGHKMSIGNFFYFVKGNFTYAKNKIKFQDEVDRSNPWMYRTGLPIGTKFGLVYNGFFQSQAEIDASARQFGVVRPGDIKYLDLDGNGILEEGLDEKPIGYSRTPEIMYGFSAGGGYKGLDFSILFQGAAHTSVMLNNEAVYEFFQDGKVKPFHLNRWTPETAETATYPLLHNITSPNNHRGSSFWIRNADYLRVKNVEIGYTLPSRFTKLLKLKSTRVFVNGMNVFTFKNALSDYYVDPEIDDGYGAMYPIQKIWAFGLDINF
ncbi:MAG: TonB-dependent receptor [Niabella sp.]